MPATLKLTHKAIGVEVRRGTYDVVVDGTGLARTIEPSRSISKTATGARSNTARHWASKAAGLGSGRLTALVEGSTTGTSVTSWSAALGPGRVGAPQSVRFITRLSAPGLNVTSGEAGNHIGKGRGCRSPGITSSDLTFPA